jgi:5-methylcytosine-specific restriction endonuclease McrA
MGLSYEARRNRKLQMYSEDKDSLRERMQKYREEKRDKKVDRLYNKSAWVKLRGMVIAKQPICPDPFGLHVGVVVQAREVHHIEPIKLGGSMWDEKNLIALCRLCHYHADTKKDFAAKMERIKAVKKKMADETKTGDE